MFYKKPNLHGRLDNFGKLTKKGKQVVLFEIYDGFGVSKEVLRLVKSVEVHYKGNIYYAPASSFREYGIEHEYMGEEQLILPKKYWHNPSQAVLFPYDTETREGQRKSVESV